MRHGIRFRKLGVGTSHRRSMLRGLATSLILRGEIETTIGRAKELRSVADKLVTLGKKNSLSAKRQAMAYLFTINTHEEGNAQKRTAMHKLFTEIAPKFSEREGGYTRVIRTRLRDGDNAQLAVIQFVEGEVSKKGGAEKRKRRTVKSAASETPAEPQA